MLVTLSGEFFTLWENPQAEAKGTYRQPKRMRKDKPTKPRRMYGTSKEEYQEWVKTRKEVRPSPIDQRLRQELRIYYSN